jgi:hypothetical protein
MPEKMLKIKNSILTQKEKNFKTSLCYSVWELIKYILAKNCFIWYSGRARMQKVPKLALFAKNINISVKDHYFLLKLAQIRKIMSQNR